MALASLTRSRDRAHEPAVGSRRRRTIVAVGIVAAIVVFYLVPERAVLGVWATDRARAHAALSSERRYASTLAEAHHIMHTLGAALAHERTDTTAVPPTPDTPGLVHAVDGAAQHAGVVLASLSDTITAPQNQANVTTAAPSTTAHPTPATLSGGGAAATPPALSVGGHPFGTIALSVEADGSLVSLDAFLAALAKTARLVVVDNVSLSQGGSVTPGQYAMTVTATSYYAPGVNAPTVGAAPRS